MNVAEWTIVGALFVLALAAVGVPLLALWRQRRLEAELAEGKAFFERMDIRLMDYTDFFRAIGAPDPERAGQRALQVAIMAGYWHKTDAWTTDNAIRSALYGMTGSVKWRYGYILTPFAPDEAIADAALRALAELEEHTGLTNYLEYIEAQQ